MKFVSIREFRNNTAAIRKSLAEEHEIVLTANGKPVALLADVDENSFEDRLKDLRRSRDLALLHRIQAKSKAKGLDKMTMEQIDAVIAKARRGMRAGQ